MTKIKKVTLLISVVLIIVGIAIYAIIGFNYNLSYGVAKRIVVPMKGDFTIEDYKSMAKEIFSKAEVEAISIFKDGVSIKVEDVNDEQLNNLTSKINEKYGYEYTKDDLTVTELPKVEVSRLLREAIIPMVVTLLIILAYMIVRYRKSKLLQIISNLVITVVLAQMLVLAIYLIFRIPVTNILLPILLTAYVISLVYCAKQCEE